MNMKQGINKVSVSDAVKEFYGKDTKTKQRVINKIFP